MKHLPLAISSAVIVTLVVLGFIFLGSTGGIDHRNIYNYPNTGPATRTIEKHAEHGDRHSMWVTATAYCSRPEETDGDPFIAAWNDRLNPKVKSIAVSRDLLDEGLHHRTDVWIEEDGMESGPYLVLDKMNKRWKRRIDVYFGTDLKGARQFGKKRVRIFWKTDSTSKPKS
ncbi:MAG: hypothetical protein O3A31_13240 [Planctomycetota bacterium]|nr:hypothetical protein [Planctomycetota bacterium]